LLPASASAAEVSGLLEVYKANMRAIVDFTSQACRVDIHVFATRSLSEAHPQDPTLGWKTLTRGFVHVIAVPGEHMSLLGGDHTAELARLIMQACTGARGTRMAQQLARSRPESQDLVPGRARKRKSQ
jgi:thioesterase domain-containing protein